MADLVRPMNEEMIYDAEEAMFHSSLRYACGRLDQVTTQLFEERENGYLTEAGSHASLVEQIDRFFQSIIAAFKRFKTSIQDKLNAKVRTKEMQQAFRQFAVNVQFLQAQGQKTVEMYDIWKIDKLLDDAWKDLYKMANRILTKRYKSLAAMDVDIRVFNERMDKAEREFNACLEKKVRVPIKDAMDLIENTVTGRDLRLTTIDKNIQGLEDLQSEVKKVIDNREIYGVDVLPEKISVIRRVTNKLSSFLHRTIGKRCAKLIAGIVFLCA